VYEKGEEVIENRWWGGEGKVRMEWEEKDEEEQDARR
jgi:hypothetical protein